MEDSKKSGSGAAKSQLKDIEIYDIVDDDDDIEEFEPIEWNNQAEDDEDIKQWYF